METRDHDCVELPKRATSCHAGNRLETGSARAGAQSRAHGGQVTLGDPLTLVGHYPK
jgi:hypothetical protein